MAKFYLKYVDDGIPFPFHVILCIVAYLFWTSSFVILLLPFVLFRLYKIMENKLISYQQLGAVISKVDLPFLHETENNRNFIVGMMEMKGGTASVKKLRKHLLSRLFDKNRELDITYKRLSQKISRHYFSYVWTDEENFSISQHVPVYKGELPKTREDTEKLFIKFISEPCPRDISPWKMRIIPKEDNSGFLLFCKIHHTLGDGFAMVGLLSNLVDKKPKFLDISNRKVNFVSSSIKRLVTGILTFPLALLALILSANRTKNPFRVKEMPMKKVISWGNPISLEYVKKIKSITDTTVNDVLMSCLAGAIRTYLINTKTDELGDLPIAMTFNSRSYTDKMKNVIPLGNNSGGVIFNLPVSIADPRERLGITQERLNRLKGLSYPRIISMIYSNVLGILPDVIARYSTSSIKRQISLIVSNVPGPVETIHMMGYPLERILFAPPLVGDTGLAVSIFSYNGDLKMTIMSDESIMKTPSEMTDLFETEVRLLGERVLEGC